MLLEHFLVLFVALLPILYPIAIALFFLRAPKDRLRLHESMIKGLNNRIDKLTREVQSLGDRLEAVARPTEAEAPVITTPERPPEAETPPAPSIIAAPQVPPEAEPPPRAPPTVATSEPLPEPEAPPPAAAPEPVFKPLFEPSAEPPLPQPPSAWDRLTTRFLENWTGFVGTIVLVAGIGFVGTYAALQLAPFYRFLLVLAASGALFTGHLALHRHPNWRLMSLWLRSAAAATFLFACAASGGLPNAGLMWIDSPGPALALLLVGVIVNLALSWTVGYQGFASLHVALSLIPIAILPQSSLALGIATAVCGFGVLLSWRTRWPIHLLVTLGIYLTYHVFWLRHHTLPLPPELLGLATGSALLVGLGGALAQVTPVCRSQALDIEALIGHLASWSMLAGLTAYQLKDLPALGGHVLGVALLMLALVAWILSAYARRILLDWLRTTDILIAQSLVLGALFTWRGDFANEVLFYGLLFLETILFLRVVIKDRGGIEVMASLCVAGAAAVGLIGAAASNVDWVTTAGRAWQMAAILFMGAAVTLLTGVWLDRYYRERIESLISPGALLPIGVIASVMANTAYLMLWEQVLIGTVAALAGIGFVLGAERYRPIGITLAAWITLLAGHGTVWLLSYRDYAGEAGQQSALLAPMVVLSLVAILKGRREQGVAGLDVAGIYLLGINAGIAIYLLLKPLSDLIPTVAWLGGSLIALEFAGRLAHDRRALAALHVGLGYVVAAALGYVTVVLPTVDYLAGINLRIAIELFGIATLLYWWLYKPGDTLAAENHWRQVRPYFLELTLALVTTAVFLDVPLVWRPLAWLAFAFLFLAPALNRLAPRLAFYSYLAFFVSILAATINVSTTVVPSPHWFDQPWNAGLIAIAVQIAYLFAAYRLLNLKQVEFPALLHGVERLSRFLSGDLPAAICYPFFAGLALFLAWRFEQAVLTFLWAAEVFVVYVLSIVFRENHFRLVAMAGMAACLVRLVFYDMRATDLFLRGLVFIGVGLLMLGMNAVYNKYGKRIEMT